MSDLHLTIDGREVTVPAGTTVFDAARLQGIAIPTLCHQQNETPVGVCRLCVVEAGGRVLSASCIRPAEEGMTVTTNYTKTCDLLIAYEIKYDVFIAKEPIVFYSIAYILRPFFS